MSIRTLIVCLCLCGSLSAQASAGVLGSGDIIRLTWEGNYGGQNGGGAFTIRQAGVNLGLTFCLEYNEHFNLNTDLLVGAVSVRAVLGGVGGQVTGFPDPSGYKHDPLSKQTAYLYQNFATGSLGGGSDTTGFIYNNSAWNNDLQRAIWYLEGEVSAAPVAGTNAAKLVSFANSYTPDKDVSNVFVLNLFKPGAPITGFDPMDNRTWSADLINNYLRQDQLYYRPPQPPPPVAPEPSSGVMWLSAMCLLAARARVRAKTANKHYLASK